MSFSKRGRIKHMHTYKRGTYILQTEEQREEVRNHIDFIHISLNKMWFDSVVLEDISDPFLKVSSHKYCSFFVVSFDFGTLKLVTMFAVNNSSIFLN